MIAREAILARVRQLPALSAAAVRVGELARDERSSAADFERTIRNDAALTANLLRIVNAACFGLRSRAASVRQAVALLGVKRTAEVAAAAALGPLIPARLPGYGVAASDFWLHSVAVASLSERLALELELERPDRIFTAGLLHDMGKLAVGSWFAAESGEILGRARAGGTLVAAEEAVLGFDHAEVGAAVADAWALPPEVTLVARRHHAPGAVPDGPGRRLVDLVHVADGLAHALGFGADAGELARAVDGGAEARLGVRPRDLERAASACLDDIRELASLFQLQGGIR